MKPPQDYLQAFTCEQQTHVTKQLRDFFPYQSLVSEPDLENERL